MSMRRKKASPRLRLAFLTVFTLQRNASIFTAPRLQDFPRAAQAFNLNLANTFMGEASFSTYFQCCRFVPQQTESTCQHLRCLAFSSNSHLTMLCFISSSCVVSSGPFSFSSARMSSNAFRNHHPAGCLPR